MAEFRSVATHARTDTKSAGSRIKLAEGGILNCARGNDLLLGLNAHIPSQRGREKLGKLEFR